MKSLKVDLQKRTIYWGGERKFWWEIRHVESISSEDKIDIRVWFTHSERHGYLIDDEGILLDDEKIKIMEIKEVEERQGGGAD